MSKFNVNVNNNVKIQYQTTISIINTKYFLTKLRLRLNTDLLPTPYSLLPTPYSLLPTTYYLLLINPGIPLHNSSGRVSDKLNDFITLGCSRHFSFDNAKSLTSVVIFLI
jgi:hypothetical protein